VKRVLVAALVVAALTAPAAAAAFVTNDPLAPQQWYLEQDRAFDSWLEPPVLASVRVAVVDSGIDGGHPEFAGRIALSKSFVGGSALTDEQGHGTFVAGEIAASIDNGVGIAGIAFPARLLIAKVVDTDGTIALDAESAAIHWAVDHGARVINLSLGGLRDPGEPSEDTYSAVEAAAVSYAVSKGVVVVAAVGNSDQAPSTPWNYASYPSALPHVIGVAALAQDGSVPLFSDRDPVFVDLAAPGQGVLSTFPRALTAARPECADQGYSDCAGDEYSGGEGTSFAAPQVSAAAALLLATDPTLKPDQVATLLERSTVDMTPSDGCRACGTGRDPLTGWGRLDVSGALAALAEPLPTADVREPNDGPGGFASTVWGSTATIDATTDWWDDRIDVYRVYVRKKQRIDASVLGPSAPGANLVLWRPGTADVVGTSKRVLAMRAAVAGPEGALSFRSKVTGWYYLEVAARRTASGPYTLSIDKS
jgi:subtilisin family serine protease